MSAHRATVRYGDVAHKRLSLDLGRTTRAEVAALEGAGARFVCTRCRQRVARIWTTAGDYVCRPCVRGRRPR